MNKNQLIQRFASNSDQKILLSHIYDLAMRRDDRNILTVSNFISETDCFVVQAFLKSFFCKNFMLYGGYNESQRRVAYSGIEIPLY